MRVLMSPHLTQFTRREESGIKRVIEAYFRYMPEMGIELVGPEATDYDLKVGHAGISSDADVAHIHGLYWTADHQGPGWEYNVNSHVIKACRYARQIIVPSEWVAESFRRDMRINPHVIPHGIEVSEWEPGESQEYVLWNKNRRGDVCDPTPVDELARRFPDRIFVTTFGAVLPEGKMAPPNIRETGLLPAARMKERVQEAEVYLATTKETFGIGILEAMASGVPVLGFKHGGVVDIVKHGETGYLAEPGNYEDLARGLDYCLKYRHRLGANGRSAARSWDWESAIEKIVKVYSLAAQPEPEPTVAVIIPSYNYADKVERAVKSAQEQTYERLTEIVVVDDGSQDDDATADTITRIAKSDPHVRYIRQENSGVAVARNRGIAEVDTKYICCLDADDLILPEFLERCIAVLESDRTLGLAYTRLQWIKPDGSEGMSQWPGDWNFDRQLLRQNQVPTCCVFRREMWERLGGYKARYAPDGAGSEDAEFWTRAGAYGYGGKLATSEPLFVYSWMSGNVTGRQGYSEPDWLQLHPWVKDGKHPFASLAIPKRFSHPVRQYDEPVISVVIPVGAGHEDKLIDALDHLEAQTFRRWEVILVDDTGNSYESREWWSAFKTAYPYARVVLTTDSPHGPGWARNAGADKARAPFLVFLDADDYLLPDALQRMLDGWGEAGNIVYTDYVGIAMVDDPEQLHPEVRERIKERRGSRTVIGMRAKDFNCSVAVTEPLEHYAENQVPYIWCNVTALIPRKWHDEIGGFDEGMKSWEDWDYHLRMAKAGKCYAHLAEEQMVYRFTTGGRRELGLQARGELLEYLRGKHGQIVAKGCGCANGKVNGSPAMIAFGMVAAEESSAMDSEFVLVTYTHPNRGDHPVVGMSTGNKYGHRSGGEQFLVHVDDIKLQPQYFKPIENLIPAPEPVLETPPPPMDPNIKAFLEAQGLKGITLTNVLKALDTAGVEDPQSLLDMGPDALRSLPGIGPKTVERIFGEPA